MELLPRSLFWDFGFGIHPDVATLLAEPWGTLVQLPISFHFSVWSRRYLFGERIWMATGHPEQGSKCELQHFRAGAIASKM